MKINKTRLDQLSIADLNALIYISSEHLEIYEEAGNMDIDKTKGWQHLKNSCESTLAGRINSLYLDEKGIKRNPNFLFM